MKHVFWISIIVILTACDGSQSATQIERTQQEQASLQAVQQVGMPAITKFAEKRMFKTILELRDKQVPTFTYVLDMQGHTHFVCNSVGYGLPYATQYTNPQMPQQTWGSAYYVLPQADPNGLYSPASAEGTWVMCVDPATKNPTPMYIEPNVIVSTFELKL